MLDCLLAGCMHVLSTQVPVIIMCQILEAISAMERKGFALWDQHETSIRSLFIHDVCIHGHFISLWFLYQLWPTKRPIYRLFVLELKLWLLLSTPSMAMCISPPMAALPPPLPPTPSFSFPTDLLQHYEELSQTASDQALRRFLQTFQDNHQQVYRCYF